MTKIALLIGVSEYQPGFDPLPGTQTDIREMQRVLQHPQMGGFDEVDVLANPDNSAMQLAIEKLLADRQRDDLVLLYFSGHGFKDDDGSLYFVTRTTEQRSSHQIYQSTAVPASVLQGWMSRSRCKRQVLMLDCCFSGAFAEGMKAKAVNETIDIAAQFGGEGRAVLTSSTALQYSFEQQEASIYTRYLVEGIETGAADIDSNGVITIDELHDYAKRKVQEAAPAMKPEIFAVKEGFKIVLAKAPLGDPKLEYRKEVEQLAQQRNGKLSHIVLQGLDEQRKALGLSLEETSVIQSDVLRPYREFNEKLQRYEQALTEALQQESPLSEETREDLKYLQKVLGLEDENIAPIENRLIPKRPHSRPRSPRPVPVAKTENPSAPALARRNYKPLVWVGVAIATLAIGVSIPSLYASLVAGKFFNQAFVKDRNGEKRDAIDDYTEAIKFKPDFAMAYNNRGAARSDLGFDLGIYQEAIQDFDQAIKLEPNLAIAYVNRGSVHSALGNKQAAVKDYKTGADLYQKQGRTKESQDTLDKIKALQK